MRLLSRLFPPARFTSGFSLVELSVVVAILSIVATLGLEVAANFVTRTATAVSRERVILVDEAIARFFKIYGRLPCPALKTTAPTAITYGQEDCSVSVSVAGTTIGNGLMAGGVPFRALNLPMMFSLDGFSNKINYVVTRNLTVAGGDSGAAPIHTGRFGTSTTVPSTTNDGIAGIEIRTGRLEEPCNSSRCQVLADPATYNGAAYIVFSSGADQRGAVSERGLARSPCARTTNTPIVDTQNCVFGDPLIRADMTPATIPYHVFYDNRINKGLNLVSYFDDSVIWRTKGRL